MSAGRMDNIILREIGDAKKISNQLIRNFQNLFLFNILLKCINSENFIELYVCKYMCSTLFIH